MQKCFILAAGYNRNTESPCSLWSFANGKSILDWQVNTINNALPSCQVEVAVGYNFDEVISQYPELAFSYVPNWKHTNALQSFLQVTKEENGSALVMYGDTVFYSETISAITNIEADVVIAVDSKWQNRFENRSIADIRMAETIKTKEHGEVEYTGLMSLSANALKWIQNENFKGLYKDKTFADLIYQLFQSDLKLKTYDVKGLWSEMNEPSDLANFVLGTKAETLHRIKPILQKSYICEQFTVISRDWQTDKQSVISQIRSKFKVNSLVVRSSSSKEDSWQTANAGVFASFLNVDINAPQKLSAAIDKVFASYGEYDARSQVLVQPFAENIKLSGVVFTSDVATGAPYYVINYDDITGRTDSVTSGKMGDLKTTIVSKFHTELIKSIAPDLQIVTSAAAELENVLGYDKLDIEFAVDKQDKVYTFQVRPLVAKSGNLQLTRKKMSAMLNEATAQYERLQKPSPWILGSKTAFSNMADWNPAEIIGRCPNPLAISLYRYLITDEVWATQRAEFGYRNVIPAPLVNCFCGQPYIDCRATLNSFIPADLPEKLASKLVDLYLSRLNDNPHLHDKIELEIVFTIWEPTFRQEIKSRYKDTKFTPQELATIEDSLKNLTAKAFLRLENDIKSVKILQRRFEQIDASNADSLEKIYQLIEDCKKYGTLAFSHAARAGFVAITLLKSLVKQKVLTKQRMLEFQGSVATVTGELQANLMQDVISLTSLVKKYGHLRPGTYDINQKAYWEEPKFFFKKKEKSEQHKAVPSKFQFTNNELLGIGKMLSELPCKLKPQELISYFGKAIQAREEVKFIFSRNLSKALDLLISCAKKWQLSRQELSYLTIDDIFSLRTGSMDLSLVKNLLSIRKENYALKKLIKLPSFINSKDNFFGFHQPNSLANYITQLNVVAELVFIDDKSKENIQGKIVAIPNADPGYDWIFAHDIAGLITQYGGANSHMAIRCAELGIPAAIGVGDKTFEQLQPDRVLLDCLKGQISHV